MSDGNNWEKDYNLKSLTQESLTSLCMQKRSYFPLTTYKEKESEVCHMNTIKLEGDLIVMKTTHNEA